MFLLCFFHENFTWWKEAKMKEVKFTKNNFGQKCLLHSSSLINWLYKMGSGLCMQLESLHSLLTMWSSNPKLKSSLQEELMDDIIFLVTRLMFNSVITSAWWCHQSIFFVKGSCHCKFQLRTMSKSRLAENTFNRLVLL